MPRTQKPAKKFSKTAGKKKPKKDNNFYVAVVRLQGEIRSNAYEDHDGISYDKFESVIKEAFAWEQGKAVALDIECCGGSPAETELIAREIRRNAKEFEKPVYAFVRNGALSGGYWLACAANKIFALPTSEVGSIGVIHKSMGFHRFNKKKGFEPRIITAGTNKSQMDPNLPLKKRDVKRMKKELAELHKEFIAWVSSRRGRKLKGDKKELFSGETWQGRRALKRGLIDGIGDLKSVMTGMSENPVLFRLFSPPKEKQSLQDMFISALSGAAGTDGGNEDARREPEQYAFKSARPRLQFG